MQVEKFFLDLNSVFVYVCLDSRVAYNWRANERASDRPMHCEDVELDAFRCSFCCHSAAHCSTSNVYVSLQACESSSASRPIVV